MKIELIFIKINEYAKITFVAETKYCIQIRPSSMNSKKMGKHKKNLFKLRIILN